MSEYSSRYKNSGKDATTLRKDRFETISSLRKKNREEMLAGRRKIQLNIGIDEVGEAIQACTDLEATVESLGSHDVNVQIQAAKAIHRLLAKEQNASIDLLIKSGILAILIKCLLKENETLQYEASCILTYISGGTHYQALAVVSADVIPHLLKLLSSPNMGICEQVILTLANVLEDCPNIQEYCVDSGLILSLVKLIQPDTPINLLADIAWIIFVLCQNKEKPLLCDDVEKLLPGLIKLMQCDNVSVLIETIWALNYLCGNGSKYTRLIIESGIVPKVIQLLNHADKQIVKAALQIVMNISAGTDEQTQFLLDHGALQCMFTLLTHKKKTLNDHALGFLSNLTGGTQSQRQAVVDSGYVPLVIELINKGRIYTKQEAICVIENLILFGTKDQLLVLFRNGVLESLTYLLDIGGTDIVHGALRNLNRIMRSMPEYLDEITQKMEEIGAVDKIDKLQYHRCYEIHTLASSIMEEFFANKDDLDADM